jgi:hypothetical protein
MAIVEHTSAGALQQEPHTSNSSWPKTEGCHALV